MSGMGGAGRTTRPDNDTKAIRNEARLYAREDIKSREQANTSDEERDPCVSNEGQNNKILERNQRGTQPVCEERVDTNVLRTRANATKSVHG